MPSAQPGESGRSYAAKTASTLAARLPGAALPPDAAVVPPDPSTAARGRSDAPPHATVAPIKARARQDAASTLVTKVIGPLLPRTRCHVVPARSGPPRSPA